MKTSTQLKALIRNLSKQSGVETEVLLRGFMMERFLERLAISRYRDNFILKGGLLVAAMVGISTRTTMDIDATLKGQSLSRNTLESIMTEIANIPLNDNIRLNLCEIEEIHEDADYPGFRVSIAATLDKTRQMLKIDITTGDHVTPKEIEYGFNLMFEDRHIQLLAYNLETVLAEKLETIVTRSVANTRMRDFYDIHILTATQPYDTDVLRTALTNTAERRGTIGQMADIMAAVEMLETSPVMASHWQRYRQKYPYAQQVSWETVTNAVKTLAVKIQAVHDLS